MKIYVAGGMREKELVSDWMRKLEAKGHTITCDWTVGEAIGDSNYSREQAIHFARSDLQGVVNADIVWHLVADYEGSRGAYVELGYAMASGRCVIVSGSTWKKSIFHHLAHRQFDTHEAAFACLDEETWTYVNREQTPPHTQMTVAGWEPGGAAIGRWAERGRPISR